MASGRPRDYDRVMGTYRAAVTGESFRNEDGSDRQQEIARCRIGEPVALERDPANPHDGNCIKVISARGVQIGNVARDAAEWMAERLDKGRPLAAVIDGIGRSDSRMLGVVLGVSTDSPADPATVPPAPAPPAPAADRGGIGGTLGFLLLLAAAAAIVLSVTDAPPPSRPVAATGSGSADGAASRLARCDRAMAMAEASGLVRERPAPHRLVVDEDLWGRLSARAKTDFGTTIACQLSGGRMLGGEYVTVLGDRSGARLAGGAPGRGTFSLR